MLLVGGVPCVHHLRSASARPRLSLSMSTWSCVLGCARGSMNIPDGVPLCTVIPLCDPLCLIVMISRAVTVISTCCHGFVVVTVQYAS